MWEGPLRPDHAFAEALSRDAHSASSGQAPVPPTLEGIYFAGFSGGNGCCQSTTSFHTPVTSICQI
jgi:hypothetical protein